MNEQPDGGQETGRYPKERYLSSVVRRAHWQAFSRNDNIVGAGFGRRIVSGERTEEPALVVYVVRKVSRRFLPPSLLLPRRIYIGGDWIEVDVHETGPIYFQSFTTRDRPAQSGISIGHNASGNTGTLACLVTDNTDGTLCILGNNHVMANYNMAVLGDAITQPGAADGGVAPKDTIATLKRFVTMNPTGNRADAAIAQVVNRADVVDQMKNNLTPVANPNHPAVGLLKAGGCNRTFMNRIDDVLSQLNVSLLAGPGSTVGPDDDMNVEKVGRSTEYTTSTIDEVDVQIKTKDPNGNSFEFDNQFSVAWMAESGDSGSLVCRGGEGGDEDKCDMCESTGTGMDSLDRDLRLDAAIEKEFREKYLSRTRAGRYLLDLFFRNETRLLDRVREAGPNDSDRAFMRYVYDKHVDTARRALLQPTRTDIHLSDEHLRDAREVLGRAAQYMRDDEREAAEALLQLAYQARDKTPQEILGMLDDERLLADVQRIISGVRFFERGDKPRPRDGEAGKA